MTYQFLENFNLSDLQKMDKALLISHYLTLQQQYDKLEEEYAFNLLQEEY